MKIKIIVLIISLVSARFLSAQTQYFKAGEVDCSPTMQNYGGMTPIVKPWNSTYTVAIHRDASATRITIMDYTNIKNSFFPVYVPTLNFPIRYIDLPPTCTINDYAIDNGVLYYCGSERINDSTYRSVVGRINIFPTGNLQHYRFYLPFVTDLKKIIVYRPSSGGTMNIALTGTMSAFAPLKTSVLVEIKSLSLSGGSYTVLALPNQEYIDEMLLVGDKIVTAGRINTGTKNEIRMRICDADNMLGTASTISTVYAYPSSTTEPNAGLYGTRISDNSFALSYIWIDASGNKKIRVRRFNSSTMANTSSVQFATTEKDEPLVMAALPQTGVLALLQPQTNSTTLYAIPLQLNPFSNNVKAFSFGTTAYKGMACAWSGNPTSTSTQEILALSCGDGWFWFNIYLPYATFNPIPSNACSSASSKSLSSISNLSVQSSTTYNSFFASNYYHSPQSAVQGTANPVANCVSY